MQEHKTLRDKVKKFIYLYDIKKVEYYDNTINLKERFEALVSFIKEKEVKCEAGEDFIFVFDEKSAIAFDLTANIDSLTIPDIRNKLSPIVNLMCLIEKDDVPKDIIQDSLDASKKAIEYLAGY